MRPNLSLCSQASSFYDRFYDMDIFVHYGPKCIFLLLMHKGLKRHVYFYKQIDWTVFHGWKQ